MNPNDIITGVSALYPWGFIKFALLTIIAMYIVFSAVIVRQDQLMSKVVDIELSSPLLKTVALIHFIASVAAFFLALVTL